MAEGRMLKKEIAKSKKIAFLKNEKARSLYFMIYPHVDAEGRISADPYDIKAICIPLFGWGLVIIEKALIDLHNAGLIILYTTENFNYLQIVRFHDFQRIDKNREANSKIPPSTAKNSRILQSNPKNSPISKVKLSKDNIKISKPSAEPFPSPTKTQKEELALLNVELLKIYKKFKLFVFMQRIKRIKGYFPPVDLIIRISQVVLKKKPENAWGYYVKVLKMELPKHFSDLAVEENEGFKNQPSKIGNILSVIANKRG